ncbi:MAG: peptidoglycan/LPS O-acetylase OafA/YrhL [Candidatus Azotimanducaceae bacterium]|jgi:peptidoglycan/LPS O-acetylase OafA/YrhL
MDELDALRGLAALSVALYHYTYYFDHLYGHSSAISALWEFGKHGVNLFFVVSGFVIYMTLEKTVQMSGFVVSRFSRLFPAYWAAMILTFFVVSVFGLTGLEISVSDALINLTMVQRFFGVPHLDNSYWTLTYELIFYFGMLVAWKVNLIKHPAVLCFAFLGYQFAVIFMFLGLDIAIPELLLKGTMVPYGHQFIVGIALFVLKMQTAKVWPHLLIGCSLLVEYLLPRVVQGPVDSNVIAMGLIVCVFYLFLWGKLRFLCVKPLIFLGTISYSFYLVHQHIGYVVITKASEYSLPTVVSVSAALVVCLTLAIVITILVERPAMRGIRGWYRNK